jgi:hypothetical protein
MYFVRRMSLLKENHVSKPGVRNSMILIVCFVLFLFYAYFSDKKGPQVFRDRGKIAWGTILEITRGKGCGLRYQICVNKQYYIDRESVRALSLEKGRVLYNRNISIPVLYDSLDPANMHPVIFKEDFDYYGIKYPDSLQEIHHLILNLK